VRRAGAVAATLVLIAACRAPAPASPDGGAVVARTALGDDYPGQPAPRSTSAVGGQVDGLTAELVEDLAAWDAADHDSRRRAARSVETKYSEFLWFGLQQVRAGDRTREIAVFHRRGRLREEEFVLIPGWRPGGTTPTIRVRPFLMLRREVRRRTWHMVLDDQVGDEVGDEVGDDERTPVAGVSWIDAVRFCMKARLEMPTDEEWEHACRAGEHGIDAADRLAGAWHVVETHRVAPDEVRGPMNGLGLTGMIDGPWEWTEPSPGAESVAVRGGGGGGRAGSCAARIVLDPRRAAPDVGLRPIFRIGGPYPYPRDDR
jgi:hypothetical protein